MLVVRQSPDSTIRCYICSIADNQRDNVVEFIVRWLVLIIHNFINCGIIVDFLMSRTSSFFSFCLFFTCFTRQLAEYFMIFVLYFYAICSELMLINSINRKIEEAEDVTDITFLIFILAFAVIYTIVLELISLRK